MGQSFGKQEQQKTVVLTEPLLKIPQKPLIYTHIGQQGYRIIHKIPRIRWIKLIRNISGYSMASKHNNIYKRTILKRLHLCGNINWKDTNRKAPLKDSLQKSLKTIKTIKGESASLFSLVNSSITLHYYEIFPNNLQYVKIRTKTLKILTHSREEPTRYSKMLFEGEKELLKRLFKRHIYKVETLILQNNFLKNISLTEKEYIKLGLKTLRIYPKTPNSCIPNFPILNKSIDFLMIDSNLRLKKLYKYTQIKKIEINCRQKYDFKAKYLNNIQQLKYLTYLTLIPFYDPFNKVKMIERLKKLPKFQFLQSFELLIKSDRNYRDYEGINEFWIIFYKEFLPWLDGILKLKFSIRQYRMDKRAAQIFGDNLHKIPQSVTDYSLDVWFYEHEECILHFFENFAELPNSFKSVRLSLNPRYLTEIALKPKKFLNVNRLNIEENFLKFLSFVNKQNLKHLNVQASTTLQKLDIIKQFKNLCELSGVLRFESYQEGERFLKYIDKELKELQSIDIRLDLHYSISNHEIKQIYFRVPNVKIHFSHDSKFMIRCPLSNNTILINE